MLSIESDISDLEVTRSRESKVMLKKSIDKHYRLLAVSLVWPIILLGALRASVKYYLKSRRDEKESSA